MLYQWIEKLKEIVLEVEESDVSKDKLVEIDHNVPPFVPKKEINFKVTHGDVIQDRKSVFQGHAAKVHSQQDAKYEFFLLYNYVSLALKDCINSLVFQAA